MKKKERKYLYLSNLDYNGTVFQTQVLDWLTLYNEKNIDFDLIEIFHVKDLRRPIYLKEQVKGLRTCKGKYIGSLYLFPSKSLLYVLNAVIIYMKIFKYAVRYREILIFSRAILGKEITFLKKISTARILFYFDGRAAAAEENKYVAVLNSDFSFKRYKIIANIYHIVYKTLEAADKIFVVSNVLRKYFEDTYNLIDKKYVLYPCLSDSEKFYYDPVIRNEIRAELEIKDSTRVYIYSGGFESEWHITEIMFSFLDHLFKNEMNSLLLFLTKDQSDLKKMLKDYPLLKARILSFSVPNTEVFKYLNAADYGILFRENTIMNNVASPTKFAEYILCGLPVLISEGIGDYSDYTVNHNLGKLIKESELKDPMTFDFHSFLERRFDRTSISMIGRRNFTKESAINNIVAELKS